MKIGIIGLGLIGGSLFKDLSKDYDVLAVSKSQSGERIFKTYDVLKDRDIVFVCTAMNKALSVLDELENYLSPETIVTDVCSLKEFVCKKERPYIFIPSHPMAGTENKGFENSFEGLFKGAKWVVIGSQEDRKARWQEGKPASEGWMSEGMEVWQFNNINNSEISQAQKNENSLSSYPHTLQPSNINPSPQPSPSKGEGACDDSLSTLRPCNPSSGTPPLPQGEGACDDNCSILKTSIYTKLIELIRYVGAEPVFTTAEEHDKAVAMISHMPMVLAQALVLSVKDNPLAKEIASSGFRDMTRLALSNEEMACDMVSMNSKNIENAILNLYKSVGELTSGNYPEIIKVLKEIRFNMYKYTAKK